MKLQKTDCQCEANKYSTNKNGEWRIVYL